MDIVRARVMRAADLQWGRLSWRQLRGLGASEGRIRRWARDGYLRQVLPHVYAVGHVAESVEGDLISAILYAGPDAMLSQVRSKRPWHVLRHVTADAALLLGHTAAMNDAAAGDLRTCDIANF